MKKLVFFLAALALTLSCQPDVAIKLSTSDLILEKGAREILTVSFTPSKTNKKDISWKSTDEDVAVVSGGTVVGIAPGIAEIIAKCGEATDKCKVTVVVSATGIKLDTTLLELHVAYAKTDTLVATVEPEGTTDNVIWETSNEAVATVADGIVTATGGGEAIITAKAGSQKAECKVTVNAIAVPEAIDLGLSVKWASFNLGATKPEENGDYFAWGETVPKEKYNSSTYKWCDNSNDAVTKYNSNSLYGTVDDKTEFKDYGYEDDAVRNALGGGWRTPTDAEWTELINNCTWVWTSNYNGTGVAGRIVTSNKTDYTDKSIFLPAAGYRWGTNLNRVGTYGYYWSSTVFSNPNFAMGIILSSSEARRYNGSNRRSGNPVRPVL